MVAWFKREIHNTGLYKMTKKSDEPKLWAFTVRTHPDLARFLRMTAASQGTSINNIANSLFEKYRRKLLTLDEDVVSSHHG
jgi:hypothetical protein